MEEKKKKEVVERGWAGAGGKVKGTQRQREKQEEVCWAASYLAWHFSLVHRSCLNEKCSLKWHSLDTRGLCALYCYPFTSRCTWISTFSVKRTRERGNDSPRLTVHSFLPSTAVTICVFPESDDTFAIHALYVLTVGEGVCICACVWKIRGSCFSFLASIQKQLHSVLNKTEVRSINLAYFPP